MSSTDCTTENITKNPALAQPCACLKASNAISTALDLYQTQTTQYNTDLTSHNAAESQYQLDHSTWLTNKQNKINQLSSEIKAAGCGWPKHQSCEDAFGSGWIEYNEQGGCKFWSPTFYISGNQYNCKRSQDQITTDLGQWLSQNPEPSEPPAFSESLPNFSSNNINCCSQVFSNISASTVNFTDIKQSCNQTILDGINAAKQNNPTTSTTPTSTTPTSGSPTSGTKPTSGSPTSGTKPDKILFFKKYQTIIILIIIIILVTILISLV